MNFVSTRDINKTANSAEAIAYGLANDGGLFAPLTLPNFSLEDIAYLSQKSYSELVAFVAEPFLPGFIYEELGAFTNCAYSNFPSNPAPIVSLDEKTHILELFHGPTLAFKDFALSLLPHLLTASLKKLNISKTAVILAATSGDTGSAALEGFANISGAKICVFYPQGGVSNIQRLQMTSKAETNVKVIGIKGNFDDAQSGVKNIFSDFAVGAKLEEAGYILSSANSINWGRIVPQIAYYFSAYTNLVNTGKLTFGKPMNVVVPTGNFGNILAAYYAKKCGLPIHKLICASNSNNVLTNFISTGVYDRKRTFLATISPSMDILISSNLERFLFELYNHDGEAVKTLITALAEEGRYKITHEAHKVVEELIYAGYADDKATLAIIKETWQKYGYLSDTHTAVGIKVYREYIEKNSNDKTPTIIAATASPFKFADSTLEALGVSALGDDFEKLAKLSEISGIAIPKPLGNLMNKEECHKTLCNLNEMKSQLFDWLKL
ncbi:MAG: threonine synthase [Defluviitaleaceae bacterium]|nr:threonine synthase [Defluviitaleaceae bacterium]